MRELAQYLQEDNLSSCLWIFLHFVQFRACAAPGKDQFLALDHAFHQPKWKTLQEVIFQRQRVVETANEPFVLGDVPDYKPRQGGNAQNLRMKMRLYMPESYKRGLLWYNINLDLNVPHVQPV